MIVKMKDSDRKIQQMPDIKCKGAWWFKTTIFIGLNVLDSSGLLHPLVALLYAKQFKHIKSLKVSV